MNNFFGAILYVMAADCVLAGLMVAAERRQEFRVRLQKRARRRAERRVEHLDDEKICREVTKDILLLSDGGGSVAEWLACLTQAQKDRGSNRSRDAVG